MASVAMRFGYFIGDGSRIKGLLVTLKLDQEPCTNAILTRMIHSIERASARSSWSKADDMKSISLPGILILCARSAHCRVT